MVVLVGSVRPGRAFRARWTGDEAPTARFFGCSSHVRTAHSATTAGCLGAPSAKFHRPPWRWRRQRQPWELADTATHRFGSILDAYVGVRPLVTSTFKVANETAEPTERDAKRVAR